VQDIEFQPLDSIRWHLIELELSNIENLGELEDIIKKKVMVAEQNISGHHSPLAHICRVVLKGHTPIFWDLQGDHALDELKEVLNEWLLNRGHIVWIDSLVSLVKPPLDLEAFSKRDDLLGEVLRDIRDLKQDQSRLKGVVERCLLPMSASYKLRGILKELPDDFNDRLVNEVESLLINLLESD